AGRIVAVRPQLNTPGFTIVDSTDIPGRNVVALIDDDQPSLAEREIRHAAEPIILLAHEDRDALLAADVQIDYAERTPNEDPEASTTIFKAIAITKCDVSAGYAAAEVVVDVEYSVGHESQLDIERTGETAVPK